MALVVPDLGEQYLLTLLLRDTVPADFPFWLGLYKNDYVPVRDTELADLVRADYAGYAPVPLVRASWNVPTDVGGVAQTFWGAGFVSFAPTSGTQTVYGYMVTDPSDSLLLWLERFPSPISISTVNPAFVLPSMRLNSLSQPV